MSYVGGWKLAYSTAWGGVGS